MNYTPFQRSRDVKADAPRRPGGGFENVSDGELCARIASAARELGNRAAAGEINAAIFLESAAHHSVIELTALCKQRPELLKERARKLCQWPVLASRHSKDREAQIKLFDSLELGTKGWFNSSSRSRWEPSDTLKTYALDVIAVIEANQATYKTMSGKIPAWVHKAAKLKPLSKTTAGNWWSVGKCAFTRAYPKPEKIQELSNHPSVKHFNGSASEKREKILDLIGKSLMQMASH